MVPERLRGKLLVGSLSLPPLAPSPGALRAAWPLLFILCRGFPPCNRPSLQVAGLVGTLVAAIGAVAVYPVLGGGGGRVARVGAPLPLPCPILHAPMTASHRCPPRTHVHNVRQSMLLLTAFTVDRFPRAACGAQDRVEGGLQRKGAGIDRGTLCLHARAGDGVWGWEGAGD